MFRISTGMVLVRTGGVPLASISERGVPGLLTWGELLDSTITSSSVVDAIFFFKFLWPNTFNYLKHKQNGNENKTL